MVTWLRRLLGVTGAILWGWLCLMPVAGFHHMVRCGLLGWAILDEENGPLEVRWSGGALALSLLLWLPGLWVARSAWKTGPRSGP